MGYESIFLYLLGCDGRPYLHDSTVMCGIAFGLLFCVKPWNGNTVLMVSVGPSVCYSLISKLIYSSCTLRNGGADYRVCSKIFLASHLHDSLLDWFSGSPGTEVSSESVSNSS